MKNNLNAANTLTECHRIYRYLKKTTEALPPGDTQNYHKTILDQIHRDVLNAQDALDNEDVTLLNDIIDQIYFRISLITE